MHQGEYKYASAGPELCLAIEFLLLPNRLIEMHLAEYDGMHAPFKESVLFAYILLYV